MSDLLFSRFLKVSCGDVTDIKALQQQQTGISEDQRVAGLSLRQDMAVVVNTKVHRPKAISKPEQENNWSQMLEHTIPACNGGCLLR